MSKSEYCYDVIIVGAGIAGIYTALSLDPKLKCLIINKGTDQVCNSYLAQGGIASVIVEEDTEEDHFQDTIKAGAGLCNEEAVKLLVAEGPNEIKRLIDMETPFDRSKMGNLHITKEGGHSNRRIVHCGGDATGKIVLKHLRSLADKQENITFIEQTFLNEIMIRDNVVVGIQVYQKKKKHYYAPNVIIATGGIGQIYQSTTNPLIATGDGIATAIRAGAKVKDMEFVQFHPTALYVKNSHVSAFLISEAVRGEGAILRNNNGEAFMSKVHKLGDLAPRDIVSREIVMQMKEEAYIYLDVTSKTKAYLKQRFPTIYAKCSEEGLDISKDWIKVHPVQHYFMGGIKTDLYGRTNIKGLFAIGESACTGIHGANRLASNSLLECLVFGRRCGEYITSSYVAGSYVYDDNDVKTSLKIVMNSNKDIQKYRQQIKQIMTESAGIIRTDEKLEKGLSKIAALLNELHACHLVTIDQMETYNMAIVANAILQAAYNRKESVGAHYRIHERKEVVYGKQSLNP